MTISSLNRSTISAITAVALSAGLWSGSAAAGERNRRDADLGAAVAVGVGAAILGTILAKKSHDRRGHYYGDRRDHEYRQAPPRFERPQPHYRAPKHEYQNSGP